MPFSRTKPLFRRSLWHGISTRTPRPICPTVTLGVPKRSVLTNSKRTCHSRSHSLARDKDANATSNLMSQCWSNILESSLRWHILLYNLPMFLCHRLPLKFCHKQPVKFCQKQFPKSTLSFQIIMVSKFNWPILKPVRNPPMKPRPRPSQSTRAFWA